MKPTTTPMPTDSPTPKATPTTTPVKFRVVAYVTDEAIPALIPYGMLTHINYAFLLPNEDGTFKPIVNTSLLNQMIPMAHQQNVRVLVSVGGWGLDKQFEAMAQKAELRAAFVQNLMKIVDQYGFDGVDIDWEYPLVGESSAKYLALLQELRQALPAGKLLTTAGAAYGQNADGIPTEAFTLLDYLNIMAYDDNTGLGHSSMDFARSSLDYWLGRGLPPEKTVLGAPFYGRGTTSWATEFTYKAIVKADPASAQADSAVVNGMPVNYNGIPTMQAKTRLAMEKASGIMFWRLEADTTGDLSLLSAIHEVVHQGK